MNRYLLSLLGYSMIWCATQCHAEISLIKQHCSECHMGSEPEGDFSLRDLRSQPDDENVDFWISSLQRVEAGEMPPAEHSAISKMERRSLISFLRKQVTLHEERSNQPRQTPPRRLNNREFENSLRQVLLLEHIGTHDPLANLLGDNLHDGFDTHGETLGMSEYHLDQYVAAVRSVLDNVIVNGQRPATEKYAVEPQQLMVVDTSNRVRADKTNRIYQGVDIQGPGQEIVCRNFPKTPLAGNYRITVSAKALDRHVYSEERTGIYDGDPIVLRMQLGNQDIDFNLQEGELQKFDTNVWLAAGTPVSFTHHTDGLRLIGNGNFKFQYRIAHDHIKESNPDLYDRVLTEEVSKAIRRRDSPSHWVHWVKYWEGPRPLIANVEIVGPLYDCWPPHRQVALLGQEPEIVDAAEILKPIADRAWRRSVSVDELSPIISLVNAHAADLSVQSPVNNQRNEQQIHIEALKEGIIAILVSPSFLLLNPEDSEPQDLFATKLSYLLKSTPPKPGLLKSVRAGDLETFEEICVELKERFASREAEEFLREFPYGWLQLDRINFMAPDVDRYPIYEKKELSEDMVGEVLEFFRHAVEQNRPVPELLTADYSFINADLAKIYDLPDVASDSVYRKYVFDNGRRGGFLGMGAFLTLTADTLNTSPIHRAVYVMENFMGIHPSPPPGDVEISEPDVRSATTIREVLAAHQSDSACSACHQNIDPFGYAFENFDPVGVWRDNYVDVAESDSPQNTQPGGDAKKPFGKRKTTVVSIPVDASATFLSGDHYDDISQYREIMRGDVNKRRFVRCFVMKLMTYANGVEPNHYSEIESIVEQSAKHDYKIVETIAAVIHSPLFRETTSASESHPAKHLFSAKLLLRRLQPAGLTDQQLHTFDALSAEFSDSVHQMRAEVGITKDLIKRRDEVYSQLKQTSLTGDELWNTLQDKAELTDAQRDAFRETQRLSKQFRSNVLALLTETQRSRISKNRNR